MQIISMKNRIALKLIVVCILMQVVFLASSSIAASFDIQAGSNGTASMIGGEGASLLKAVNSDEKSFLLFRPTQTGLYRINVGGTTIMNDNNYASTNYRLDRVTNMQLSSQYTFTNVSLASEKKGDDVHFATDSDTYRKSSIWDKPPVERAVMVILDANSLYAVRMIDEWDLYYIQIQKKPEDSGAMYGFSNNFPSAWITMGQKNAGINSADPQIEKYPTMNVATKKVNELIETMGLEDVTNDDHAFQWLERILVYVIFTIGNTIIDLFEQALGLSRLTLDNLIFNKMDVNYNNPIIDLRPLRRNRKIIRC